MNITLTPIDFDGTPRGFEGLLPAFAREVLRATRALYESNGFEEPWIGYLTIADSVPVGTCGFKSAPDDGRVEIAYFTFPDFEGQGLATAMAGRLTAIAQCPEPDVIVEAQTLPERNASTRVLEKSSFRRVATLDHPEDGKVWEWHRVPTRGAVLPERDISE